jgi:pSer/pThr/pTyr-binding forkhead associated (FHA) protein
VSLRLRIEHGQDAGRTWRLPAAGVYTVGRTPANSIRVLDMKVSKRHCEIRVAERNGRIHAVLHDLGSTHGCTLNGQPVTKDVLLKPGDELRLGLTIARILSDGKADEDVQPVAGRTVNGDDMAAADSHEAHTKQTLPPDALVGRKLGGYQVERKIGAGGMGGVYLAEQVSLHREVALKVLNEKFAADSTFVDQFVNEARAAGALNHPNVVQVYDVGSDQGYYFFSMEVMPGGSIEDKLREGPIPWQTALNWFLDATNALIFAKRREILHRDVKPDNLMIAEDGSAKLCDLGLAKKSEVGDLMDQGIIGTPHFISPEAIRRKNDIDQRTDLYSLGCTFFRIFSGRNPYPGTTVKDILLGHLNKPIPRIGGVNRNVPREIDELVFQLMQKDPDERIQTPEELLRELDHIRTRYNLEAHGIKPASKKPLILAGAAVLVAVILAVYLIFLKPPPPKGPSKLSAKQQAELDEAARTAVRGKLSGYLSDATTTFSKLEAQRVRGALGPDNYEASLWGELSQKYGASADAWETQEGEWGRAEKKAKDEIIRGYYKDYRAQLLELAHKARKTAREEIDDRVAKLKKNAAAFAKARQAALANADHDIREYAAKLKKMLDDGDYVTLETYVKKDEKGKTRLDGMVGKLLAQKFDGEPVLSREKDVKPLLDKYMPANAKGARGTDLLVRALKKVDEDFAKAMDEAQKALGQGEPGHEQYKAARGALERYLKSMPAGLDKPALLSTAPGTVSRLRAHAEKAKRTETDLARRDDALRDRELAADRDVWHGLLVKLWNPHDGLLRLFDTAGARQAVKEAQGKLHVKGYQELAAAWLPRLDALDGLLAHVVKSYPDNWVDDEYTYLDDHGHERTGHIRGIDAHGAQWNRETRSFADSGPKWVLEKLLFFQGKPRWMKTGTCTPQDHWGIALVAEMAGDYKLARTHYEAARAALGDAPGAAALVTRLQNLDDEARAAADVQAVWAFERKWNAWWEKWKDEAARAVGQGTADPDPSAFPREHRGKVVQEGVAYKKEKAAVDEALRALRGDPRLSGTWWGASWLAKTPKGVAFIGEHLPSSNAPPSKKKDGAPGKDAPGKDAPGKDAPPKDGRRHHGPRRSGKSPPGKDAAPGKDAPGKDAPGKDAPGKGGGAPRKATPGTDDGGGG